MKANWQLFGGLSVFYVIMAVIYYYVGGEAVGITGMILAACLAGMVGFYVWFTQKRIGFDIPSDDLNAEIADDAGELGFYSPHSWWPLPVAVSATATVTDSGAAALAAVTALATTVASLKTLITTLTNLVLKIQKKVKA